MEQHAGESQSLTPSVGMVLHQQHAGHSLEMDITSVRISVWISQNPKQEANTF